MARRPAHIASGLALAIAACSLAGLFVGCAKPVTSTHGRDKHVTAEYAGGTLTARTGREINVLTIKAAAEQTLRARGYIITESFASADRMKIEASGPGEGGSGGGRRDRTTIEAWHTPAGSKLTIESGVFGDETASKLILDEMLYRLGR